MILLLRIHISKAPYLEFLSPDNILVDDLSVVRVPPVVEQEEAAEEDPGSGVEGPVVGGLEVGGDHHDEGGQDVGGGQSCLGQAQPGQTNSPAQCCDVRLFTIGQRLLIVDFWRVFIKKWNITIVSRSLWRSSLVK